MNKTTQLTTSRILEFAQKLQLNFSEYTIWNYFWKKYKRDETTSKAQIAEAFELLIDGGWIEPVYGNPGYYSLTEKGKAFAGWSEAELAEGAPEPLMEEPKGWTTWF